MAFDLPTAVVSILGSGGAAFLAIKWFAQRAVEHGFDRDLARHQAALDEALTRTKASLDADAAEAKSRLDAALHRSTESLLGEEAAERTYRFEARKRLYTAVGPLRFQLIVACVQYCDRIKSLPKRRYSMRLDGYFGRSLLFRLGRVLALTELIERQIAHADFSVDPATIVLLRFRAQALRALSSSDVPLDHPAADWTRQAEHIYRDQLPIVAVSMVVPGPPERVVRFDEFLHLLEQNPKAYLQPLSALVAKFDMTKTPILWLRLIALAEACSALIDSDPAAAALDPPEIDPAALIAASGDDHVTRHAQVYAKMVADFRAQVVGPAPVVTASDGAGG